MSGNYNNGPRISNDRFGNPFQLARTKVKKGKEGGEFDYAYFELGGKLYKIDVSECQKEKEKEKHGNYWVKVTLQKKQNKVTSM